MKTTSPRSIPMKPQIQRHLRVALPLSFESTFTSGPISSDFLYRLFFCSGRRVLFLTSASDLFKLCDELPRIAPGPTRGLITLSSGVEQQQIAFLQLSLHVAILWYFIAY